MAFSNQFYTAPSIPKLSKKTISSPLIRGASKISTTLSAPKLKISRESFRKKSPLGDDSLINTVVDNNQSIDETNRILVEIQKQLALDFAYRIAEERDFIKQLKKQESKRKFKSEEDRLEKGKKTIGAADGVINKVTAPIKGIFEKIIEFFSLILTGIVLNAAFKWLQNPENREKLFKIFDFIGDAFVPFVITVLTIKLLKQLYKVFKIAKKILKIAGLFKGKPPSLPTGGNLCNALLNCFGAKAPVTSPIKSPSLNPVTALAPTLFPGGIPKPIPGQKPVGQKPVGQPVGQPPAGQLPVRERQRQQNNGPNWGNVWNALGIGAGVVALWGIAEVVFKAAAMQLLRSKGGTIPGTIAQGKKCDACSLGFSAGGSVYGKGSANVDSVSAMLAPGEEVIRTSSAAMYRPLLKDINDNAGRLWSNFSLAVNKLGSVTSYQKDVSDEFYKTIQELDRNLKDDITRRRVESPMMPAGGFGSMQTHKPNLKMKISPSPKRMNIPMKSKRSGGMTFIPFTLPTQRSAPPQMPEIKSGQETDSPQVSSVNTLDPYIMTTAEKYYGIFVG